MTNEAFTRLSSMPTDLVYGEYHMDVVNLMDKSHEMAYISSDLQIDTTMNLRK